MSGWGKRQQQSQSPQTVQPAASPEEEARRKMAADQGLPGVELVRRPPRGAKVAAAPHAPKATPAIAQATPAVAGDDGAAVSSGPSKRRGGRRRGGNKGPVAGAGDISNQSNQPRARHVDAFSEAAAAEDEGEAPRAPPPLSAAQVPMMEEFLDAEDTALRYKMYEGKQNRVKTRSRDYTVGGVTLRMAEQSVVGQDDAVYERNPDVWELVLRGHCIVSVQPKPGDAWTAVGEMLGMHKFGYRDSRYGRRDLITHAVAVEKENGECAHLGAFKLGDERWWLSGSKHVTIAFRDEHASADLEYYKGMEHTGVAYKISKLTEATLNRLSPQQRSAFHENLVVNGWTANAEAILADSEHIVDYNGVDELRFYALTRAGATQRVGLCVAPEKALAFFTTSGVQAAQPLPRVAYNSSEFSAQVHEIARRSNSEGVVMYGMDAKNRVVCMWKEKSYPYVMERIVREAIKGGKTGDVLLQYVLHRLSKMERSLRGYFSAWERDRLPFLLKFGDWLVPKKRAMEKTRSEPYAVDRQWLTLQRECQADMKAKGIVCQPLPPEKLKAAERAAEATTENGDKIHTDITVVMLAGPPGSGKSTVARALHAALTQLGQRPAWLNQDEAGGNRKQFLNGIERLVALPAGDPKRPNFMIMDKTNMASANRADYAELGIPPTVSFVFQHPEGSKALADLCCSRIGKRGLAHRSMRVGEPAQAPESNAGKLQKEPMTQSKVEGVLSTFTKTADWPADGTVVPIDITQTPLEVLQACYGAVRQMSTTFDPKALNADATVDLPAAMNTALEYEGQLATLSTQKQLFASLKIVNPKAVFESLPANVLNPPLVLKTGELHITLCYFGGVVNPSVFVAHAKRLGEKMTVRLDELVYNNQGACVTVSGPFQCDNAAPHITLANAKGVQPVYSNQLLGKDRHLADTKSVALGSEVEAVFAFQ